MTPADIGKALDRIGQDALKRTAELVAQYRSSGIVGVLKQAVDTPHRARAQIAAWMSGYDATNGAGAAQVFLVQCLTAAGARSLAIINSELAGYETAAQTLVTNVNVNHWTWDQVASAIESQLKPTTEQAFDYSMLPIPVSYRTVWGDAW